MKIVVVDFAASEGGALAVLKDFAQAVKKYGRNHQWVFLLSEHHIEESPNISLKIISKNRVNRLAFDDFNGAKIINKMDPDVVVNFQNTVIQNILAPQIIYLHQPLPFQKQVDYNFFKKSELRYAIIQKIIGKRIKKGLPKAEKIIVQTEWMKEAVKEEVQLEDEKIYVVPPDIDTNVPDSKNKQLNYNKFFYPTGDLHYKNINILEEASKIINDLDFEIEITIDRFLNNKHINTIGKIPREAVFKKYAETILLFPSKIETFGMPLAEARKIGTIIIASDTKFSREILKDYNNAYFFDPNNAKELSEIMKKCIKGCILKKPNNEKNIVPQQNSWKTVIDTILTR